MQRNESGDLVSTDRHISEQHTKPVDRDEISDDLTLMQPPAAKTIRSFVYEHAAPVLHAMWQEQRANAPRL